LVSLQLFDTFADGVNMAAVDGRPLMSLYSSFFRPFRAQSFLMSTTGGHGFSEWAVFRVSRIFWSISTILLLRESEVPLASGAPTLKRPSSRTLALSTLGTIVSQFSSTRPISSWKPPWVFCISSSQTVNVRPHGPCLNPSLPPPWGPRSATIPGRCSF